MPVTLTGVLSDITGQAVDDVRRIFVTTAPRVVQNSDTRVTVPDLVELPVSASLSVSLEPGPSVLQVYGRDWSAQLNLWVEATFTTLREAIAASPGHLSAREISELTRLSDSAWQALVQTVAQKDAAQVARDDADTALRHVDDVAEAVSAALDRANVFAQDQVPPYLQKAALNTTYVPRGANTLDDGTPRHGAMFGGDSHQARLHALAGNTGLGYYVLNDGKHTGSSSVAVGSTAGMIATTGSNLTFVGTYAGGAVTTAHEATHVGSFAGFEVPGGYNTSLGSRAMCGPNLPRVAGPSASAGISGTEFTAWLAKTPTGVRNTAVGKEALSTLGSGSDNVAVGYLAAGGQGPQVQVTGMTVSGTTVSVTVTDAGGLPVGEPLMFLTAPTGFTANTPVAGKLYNVTSRSGNTFTYEQSPAPEGTYASGGLILGGVITGNGNTAVGSNALFYNQRGSSNVAFGANSLYKADVGSHNVGIGYAALHEQTNGASNVAIGSNAAFGLTTGQQNVFVGRDAGYPAITDNKTTTASGQTIIGYQAGQGSTAVSYSITAVGSGALASGNYASALGHNANASGAGAVAIGCDSSNTGAAATAANEIVLGTALHRVRVPGLPTTKPTTGSGYLWNDAGVVKIA